MKIEYLIFVERLPDGRHLVESISHARPADRPSTKSVNTTRATTYWTFKVRRSDLPDAEWVAIEKVVREAKPTGTAADPSAKTWWLSKDEKGEWGLIDF